jgi:crotonobetainyl-CoA:carnitine CoA-transferase CaiB-like acyl-CoA transferase
MQAFSGLADLQSDPDTGEPRFVRNIVCDKSTALVAAQAITAALLARARGEGGQHVRLAMLDAAIGFLWPDGMQEHTYLGLEPSAPVSRALLPQIRRTADGFVTFNTIQEGEFQGLCRALGRSQWLGDERFATPAKRAQHAEELRALVDALVAERTTADLVASLEAEDVPFAVVNRVATLHEDPQVRARGVLEETEHPTAGRMRTPRPAARFERTPSSPQRHAPLLGEHTDELLTELGVPAAEIAALREHGVVA